jgi:hypothetical protein
VSRGLDKLTSCIVAPSTKCNYATATHENATITATNGATIDLLTLAKRVIERYNATCIATPNANTKLQQIDLSATLNELHALKAGTTYEASAINTTSHKSCGVALHIGGNHATNHTNKKAFNMDKVSCNSCEHFIPDAVGDGVGIGECGLGIKWTQEYNGRMPLYRYTERHCDRFSNLS